MDMPLYVSIFAAFKVKSISPDRECDSVPDVLGPYPQIFRNAQVQNGESIMWGSFKPDPGAAIMV